jgi:uncharacterized membrane protein
MAKLVLGAFRDRVEADETIKDLEDAGVPREDFSLIAQDVQGGEEEQGIHTRKISRDTAAAGGVVGGLAGLVLGAIATAGLLVAGPVVLLAGLGWIALTTVAGGAVGAAAGGIVGALVGLGVPERTAREHETVLNEGGVLLGAEDDEISESEIMSYFKRHGAEHITVVEHGKIEAKVAATAA